MIQLTCTHITFLSTKVSTAVFIALSKHLAVDMFQEFTLKQLEFKPLFQSVTTSWNHITFGIH